MSKAVNIEPSWAEALSDHFASPGFIKLSDFIRSEYLSKKVYPKPENIFKAFWLTPLANVKVVILGQDPYHGPGQAHGLCFSVPEGVTPPPSLVNIYKEITQDLGIAKDLSNGNLEAWADQGVFLLNAILTVVASTPASHQKLGWEDFTDQVIRTISERREHVVFLLWGNYARAKRDLIDSSKHLILEAPHPSPFSAYSGFFGSRHFSQANDYLLGKGIMPINW